MNIESLEDLSSGKSSFPRDGNDVEWTQAGPRHPL